MTDSYSCHWTGCPVKLYEFSRSIYCEEHQKRADHMRKQQEDAPVVLVALLTVVPICIAIAAWILRQAFR